MTDLIEPHPPARRAALGFIFFAVVLDVLALGVTAPVLPRLIQSMNHGDAAGAARYIGWFATSWALMQFVFSPILGGLSDRFGRRPVMLISMFGLALDYMVMAVAPSLGWLFLGRLASGVSSSSFSTANAYIADITPPELRASRFGILGAAFGIGFVFGPALGGLLGAIDPRAPFWAAAALSLLNGFYGLVVLPESLPKDKRSAFSFKLANPLGSFALYRSRPGLLRLAGIVFIYYLAHQVLQTVWVPYVDYRYGWSALLVGGSLALVGIGSILIQGFVVKRVVPRFGERGALYAGLTAGALGYALYGLAPSGGLFMAAIPVFSFMGLVMPGVQGLLSRSIGQSQQGRLQGANAGVMAIASLIGPILFTELFARSIAAWRSWAPVGLAFDVAAILLGLGLILALASRPTAAPALAESA